jgi:hypothetical protein
MTHAGQDDDSLARDSSFGKAVSGVPHDVSTAAMPAQLPYAPQFPAGLVGCVVVFGGVAAGGSWLTDVNLVMLTNHDSGVTGPAESGSSRSLGGLSSHVQPVPMSLASTAQQQHSERAFQEEQDHKPQPAVDFAACACGSSGFVVVGGFNGKEASMQIQRCTLAQAHRSSSSSSSGRDGMMPRQGRPTSHAPAACSTPGAAAPGVGMSRSTAAAPSSSSQQAATAVTAAIGSAPEGAPAAASNHAHGHDSSQQQSPEAAWAASWECTWDVLVPRTRSPVGRCHHSCCWHAPSRSLVVFGGYSDRRGCLDDVAVFSMDHCEWWQPQCTGAYAAKQTLCVSLSIIFGCVAAVMGHPDQAALADTLFRMKVRRSELLELPWV